jgi:hypothetical protein
MRERCEHDQRVWLGLSLHLSYDFSLPEGQSIDEVIIEANRKPPPVSSPSRRSGGELLSIHVLAVLGHRSSDSSFSPPFAAVSKTSPASQHLPYTPFTNCHGVRVCERRPRDEELQASRRRASASNCHIIPREHCSWRLQGGLLSGKDPTEVNLADPLRLWIIQVGTSPCSRLCTIL